MITATRGTRTAPALIRWAPRFLLAPLLDMAARRSAAQPGGDPTPESHSMSPRRRHVLWVLLWPVRRFAASKTAPSSGEDETAVPLSDLVPTMHFDAQLVLQSEGRLQDYRAIAVPVLLLGGSDSPTYLQGTLDALETTLPSVRRVELPGVGHLAPDNTGEPERVAGELRRFFRPENSA